MIKSNGKLYLLLGLSILFMLVITPQILADSTDLVYKIPVEGYIDIGLWRFVERSIAEAEEARADVIIFEVDTYGGEVDPAVKIRDSILRSTISTVTYVKGRAWSAGALISLAGKKLVMIDGSSIGAAETRPNEEKYISAFRKEFKATAEAREKNADLAAAMVDSDIEIDGIIAKDKLLTLTAAEAVKHNISDLKIFNIQQLYNKLEFSPGRVELVEMNMTEKAARFITRPTVTTMLITIGVIALIAEIFIAGFGVSGTIGFLSLAMVFSSHIYFGGANWGLAILFAVGLLLLALEVFVIPGFGITGIGGLIALFTSIFFLFSDLEVALMAIATIMILSIAGFVVLLKLFGSSRLGKNISLEESQTRESGYLAQSDKKDLTGKTGKTITPLRPAGMAEIEGERIDVVSEGNFIKKGEKVIVFKIAGNRVVVKKLKEE